MQLIMKLAKQLNLARMYVINIQNALISMFSRYLGCLSKLKRAEKGQKVFSIPTFLIFDLTLCPFSPLRGYTPL